MARRGGFLAALERAAREGPGNNDLLKLRNEDKLRSSFDINASSYGSEHNWTKNNVNSTWRLVQAKPKA